MTISVQQIFRTTTFLLGVCTFFLAQQVNAEGNEVTLQFDYQTATSTTHALSLRLAPSDTLLNVYEATLFFDPESQQVSAVDVESGLCEKRFLIEFQVDNDRGTLYIACGTALPFGSTDSSESILTVYYDVTPGAAVDMRLGEKTNFHVYDGLGTIAPLSMGPDIYENSLLARSDS